MMAADQFSIAPLITMAVDAEDLREWALTAAVRERLVYARGRVPPRTKPVWDMARQLAELGLITTIQARAPDGMTYYLAERCPAPTAISDDARPEARVFREIERCCDGALPMPGNADLARRCGLTGPDAAAYALKLLRSPMAGARRIVLDNMGPGRPRVATIIASNKRTFWEDGA